MTVYDHLRIFRERWLSIVASVVLGVCAGVGFFALQPSQYTANLQMYVSSPVPSNSESSFLSASQVAQERVLSYTELATSPRVTGEVVRSLRLPVAPDDLSRQISATATDKSVVLTISVTDRSAQGAAEIANAVGAALRDTVNDVERSEVPGAVAPVSIRAVEPAPVPTDESSLGVKRLVGIGLLAGLAVGVALALARNALNNSITSVEQLAQLTDAPNLGTVSQASRLSKAPLVVQDDPQGPVAEDFKRLRTNIQFVDVGNEHKVLAISSALPGEGKTTTVVNLAAALATAGNRVLLLDGDLRRPKSAEMLGVNPYVGLTSVLSRRAGIDEVVQTVGISRFDVIATGPLPPNPSELLACRQMQELILDVRRRYDLVLIDTPPLLPVTDAAALAPLTDGVILVCRHQKTTRSQVSAAAAAVRAVEVPVRGTILTMTDQSKGLPAYSRTYRAEGPTIDPTPASGPSSIPLEDDSTLRLERRTSGDRPRPRPASPRPTPGGPRSSRAGR